MAPDLQASLFAVEPRVVTRAVQRLISGDITERIALMRAEGRKRDDIAVRPDPALDLPSELDDHAGRILVRILDLDRLVDFKLVDIYEPDARVSDARERWRGLGSSWDHSRCRCCCGRSRPTPEELTTAQFDRPISALHGSLPVMLSTRCQGYFDSSETIASAEVISQYGCDAFVAGSPERFKKGGWVGCTAAACVAFDFWDDRATLEALQNLRA